MNDGLLPSPRVLRVDRSVELVPLVEIADRLLLELADRLGAELREIDGRPAVTRRVADEILRGLRPPAVRA